MSSFFSPPQDMFYHFIALLFYFSAFVLEAATTAASKNAVIATQPDQSVILTSFYGNVITVLSGRRHGINVVATVSTV